MIRRGHAAKRRVGRGSAHASRAAFSRCSVSAVVRVQHLVRFVALPRLIMSNMLKKIMSLSMVKKLNLCALPCTPVGWRVLRACASAGRVPEKWRCKKVWRTHHEKHVGAVDAMQQEQQRDAPVKQSALRAKNVALVEVVDGGAGAVRGFARLGLMAETRSRGTAPCRPRRHR